MKKNGIQTRNRKSTKHSKKGNNCLDAKYAVTAKGLSNQANRIDEIMQTQIHNHFQVVGAGCFQV